MSFDRTQKPPTFYFVVAPWASHEVRRQFETALQVLRQQTGASVVSVLTYKQIPKSVRANRVVKAGQGLASTSNGSSIYGKNLLDPMGFEEACRLFH